MTVYHVQSVGWVCRFVVRSSEPDRDALSALHVKSNRCQVLPLKKMLIPSPRILQRTLLRSSQFTPRIVSIAHLHKTNLRYRTMTELKTFNTKKATQGEHWCANP